MIPPPAYVASFSVCYVRCRVSICQYGDFRKPSIHCKIAILLKPPWTFENGININTIVEKLSAGSRIRTASRLNRTRSLLLVIPALGVVNVLVVNVAWLTVMLNSPICATPRINLEWYKIRLKAKSPWTSGSSFSEFMKMSGYSFMRRFVHYFFDFVFVFDTLIWSSIK